MYLLSFLSFEVNWETGHQYWHPWQELGKPIIGASIFLVWILFIECRVFTALGDPLALRPVCWGKAVVLRYCYFPISAKFVTILPPHTKLDTKGSSRNLWLNHHFSTIFLSNLFLLLAVIAQDDSWKHALISLSISRILNGYKIIFVCQKSLYILTFHRKFFPRKPLGCNLLHGLSCPLQPRCSIGWVFVYSGIKFPR